MFFDNSKYFAFVKECRKAGITVPIIPGLKILTRRSNLQSLPRNFYIDLPSELAKEVTAANNEDIKDIGVEWAVAQSRELLANGVPSIHFYVMTNSNAIRSVMKNLR